MNTFKYLCFLLACYAITPDMGEAQGYKLNLSRRNASPKVQMPKITEADIEKAFSDADKCIRQEKAHEKKLSQDGMTVNRKMKSVDSVFHNVRSTLRSSIEKGSKQAPFDRASDVIINKYKLNSNQVNYGMPQLPLNSPNAAAAREACTSGDNIQCDPNNRYRTIDGTCNNLANPTWGSASSCFQRLIPSAYEGESGFRRSMADGSQLPEPRTLSLNIHSHMNRPTNYVTHMYMFYGQFLDHDISLTAPTTTADNEVMDCCQLTPENRPQWCAPISISRNDPFYSTFGITCLNFVRSQICPSCALGTREQLNQITAFIDASHIYDNDQIRTGDLRMNDGTGRLRFQQTSTAGVLLPPSDDPANDQCSIPAQNQTCFIAGDSRANQHPTLASMHTVFLREHNRIAGELRRYNPRWGEERLFQEARRILGAFMQMITYNEYLPITLGNERMSYFKLWISSTSTTYDPTLKPSLYTGFSTAAFRFGHSMIHTLVAETPQQPNHSGHQLRDVFFYPFGLYENEVDQTLRGSTNSPSQWFDRNMVPDVTNFLYRVRGNDTGSDLASLNIQRGRDHGLPGYTAYVEFCSQGDIIVRSFNDLVYYKLMTSDNMNLLQRNYRSVHDIDMFTGCLSEIYNSGAVVGPTATCIIGLQFQSLKFGDRFYFEHSGQSGSFTSRQMNELRKVTLSKIMCDNTRITALPRYAMLYESQSNPMTQCGNMPYVDLRAWQE